MDDEFIYIHDDYHICRLQLLVVFNTTSLDPTNQTWLLSQQINKCGYKTLESRNKRETSGIAESFRYLFSAKQISNRFTVQ